MALRKPRDCMRSNSSTFWRVWKAAYKVFAGYMSAGLYYLAELIEEYSVLAKKILTYLLIFVLVIYIALLIDGLPWLLILSGLLAHVLFGSLLTTFPIISLLSPGFLGGTFCLLVAHYLAFQYFAEEWHTFQEVLSFFFICLWLVPFGFFISLSANDMVLPTIGEEDGSPRRPRRSGFLALIDFMASKIGSVTPSRSSKSL